MISRSSPSWCRTTSRSGAAPSRTGTCRRSAGWWSAEPARVPIAGSEVKERGSARASPAGAPGLCTRSGPRADLRDRDWKMRYIEAGSLAIGGALGGGLAEDRRRVRPVPRELRGRRIHAVVVQVMAERGLAEAEVATGVGYDELVPEVVAPAGLRDERDVGVGRMRKQELPELGEGPRHLPGRHPGLDGPVDHVAEVEVVDDVLHANKVERIFVLAHVTFLITS